MLASNDPVEGSVSSYRQASSASMPALTIRPLPFEGGENARRTSARAFVIFLIGHTNGCNSAGSPELHQLSSDEKSLSVQDQVHRPELADAASAAMGPRRQHPSVHSLGLPSTD